MGGNASSKRTTGQRNTTPTEQQRVRTEQTTRMAPAQPETPRPVLTDRREMARRRSELMTKLINKTANRGDIEEYNDLSKRLGRSTNASLFLDYNE